ncbi:hypothetical protein CGZ90_00820 [Fictibacillus aquaticus]|uniref:HK97 gp10 family phage protein n=1 Tax=Fictibacillus aquaticus TaxID=2021314 RepID=A0A235FEG1_9BACL|nr:hypothetical protein CGZ90_00820 [Fictibacillus aquaticus]
MRIEWDGLQELEQLFDNMNEEFEKILLEEYSQYGKLVEEGAKALVHKDTGDLEESLNFGQAQREGNLVVVEGGSNLPYALKQHESPKKGGIRAKYDNGAKFENFYKDGLGEKTRAKPPWRGFKPGRKFLQNAINATKEDYDEMNKRILKRTLGGGRG